MPALVHVPVMVSTTVNLNVNQSNFSTPTPREYSEKMINSNIKCPVSASFG